MKCPPGYAQFLGHPRRQFERSTNWLASQLLLDLASACKGPIRGAVEQKQAALAQAEVNLQFTEIRSPIDGIELLSGNLSEGDDVIVGITTGTERDAGSGRRRIGMMEALVCATGLSKRHQVGGTAVQALADVSLTIDPGELVGVVGARVPANRRS